MKRCPQCRRDYFDDTLSFCLEDGSPLILGLSSVTSTDQPTMIHSTAAPDSVSSTSFVPPQAYQAHNDNAIAVLPFTNISPDNTGEFLSDGLAEELLNVLSRINGLRVAGRTSAFSFKGKQTTLEEPTETFGGWARAIIEVAAGSVDRAETILDEYIRDYASKGAFQIAEICTAMGRTDQAFEYLETAHSEHDPGLADVLTSGILKPLHTDARWHPFLRKIGIPEQYWPMPQ